MNVLFDARNSGSSVSHANSLDLVRICAALCVLFSHQFALLGYPEPAFAGVPAIGGIGVSIFFFLSGMLVSQSWVRDPVLRRFFFRRVLRIFPALLVVVLLVAFVVGPLMTNLPLFSYLINGETWLYLASAVLWIQHYLPGVFVVHPFPGAVNGSLWTLPLEFLCYLTVAGAGVFNFFGGGRRDIFAGVGVLCMIIAVMLVLPDRFQVHLEMVAAFWFGVLFGSLRRFKEKHGALDWTLIVFVFVILLLYASIGSRGLERTMLLAYSVGAVLLGLSLTAGASLTHRLGDISYGLYIYAFPVQQLLVAAGRRYDWSIATHLVISLVVTTVLAWISWHAIEKRALRFKPSKVPKVRAPVMVGL